ncbi:MAG: helix-turn-helix domain-containing protein, partial [Solirubrobacteraceae bacterium]
MSTRSYEQRLRAQRAEATRRRILDAVYARLREAPTQPVGLDRVARMAGVSRSTVYLIFGSRAGLFDALGSDLLDRGGFEQVLDAAANPDARASVREGIGAVVRMYASERDVVRVLHSMATLDPDAVGGAIQRMERRRASGIAQQAQRLADDKLLRP